MGGALRIKFCMALRSKLRSLGLGDGALEIG
jgi:hypothetical protein